MDKEVAREEGWSRLKDLGPEVTDDSCGWRIQVCWHVWIEAAYISLWEDKLNEHEFRNKLSQKGQHDLNSNSCIILSYKWLKLVVSLCELGACLQNSEDFK